MQHVGHLHFVSQVPKQLGIHVLELILMTTASTPVNITLDFISIGMLGNKHIIALSFNSNSQSTKYVDL